MNFYLNTILLLQIVSTSWAVNCGNPGGGTICTLAATKDVWLEGNSNKNSYNFLIVGKHPQYAKKRFLVQFENIPSTCSRVKWAKMYIYFWYAHKASWQSVQSAPYIPRELKVHQVLKSWNERQATARRRIGSLSWNHTYLGLDGTDAMAYSQGEGVVMYTGQPARYIEFDITDASRNWRSGQNNYGVLVWATNEDIDGRDLRFYSKERSSKKPFMTVACA